VEVTPEVLEASAKIREFIKQKTGEDIPETQIREMAYAAIPFRIGDYEIVIPGYKTLKHIDPISQVQIYHVPPPEEYTPPPGMVVGYGFTPGTHTIGPPPGAPLGEIERRIIAREPMPWEPKPPITVVGPGAVEPAERLRRYEETVKKIEEIKPRFEKAESELQFHEKQVRAAIFKQRFATTEEEFEAARKEVEKLYAEYEKAYEAYKREHEYISAQYQQAEYWREAVAEVPGWAWQFATWEEAIKTGVILGGIGLAAWKAPALIAKVPIVGKPIVTVATLPTRAVIAGIKAVPKAYGAAMVAIAKLAPPIARVVPTRLAEAMVVKAPAAAIRVAPPAMKVAWWHAPVKVRIGEEAMRRAILEYKELPQHMMARITAMVKYRPGEAIRIPRALAEPIPYRIVEAVARPPAVKAIIRPGELRFVKLPTIGPPGVAMRFIEVAPKKITELVAVKIREPFPKVAVAIEKVTKKEAFRAVRMEVAVPRAPTLAELGGLPRRELIKRIVPELWRVRPPVKPIYFPAEIPARLVAIPTIAAVVAAPALLARPEKIPRPIAIERIRPFYVPVPRPIIAPIERAKPALAPVQIARLAQITQPPPPPPVRPPPVYPPIIPIPRPWLEPAPARIEAKRLPPDWRYRLFIHPLGDILRMALGGRARRRRK